MVLAVVVSFAALVVAYVVLVSVFDLSLDFDSEPFRDWVEQFGPLGPLLFIGVMAVSVLVAPIPNVPIFLAAGLAWGWLLGSVYSMAGLMLGSVMAFFVARAVGRRHLSRLIGARAAANLDHVAETMGGRVIFWARMLPAINFDWISFVAGMTSIRFRTFAIFSFLGMLLPTVVTVAAGDGLARDMRVTLGMAGIWVAGILASASYFWWRGRKARQRATVMARAKEGESQHNSGAETARR